MPDQLAERIHRAKVHMDSVLSELRCRWEALTLLERILLAEGEITVQVSGGAVRVSRAGVSGEARCDRDNPALAFLKAEASRREKASGTRPALWVDHGKQFAMCSNPRCSQVVEITPDLKAVPLCELRCPTCKRPLSEPSRVETATLSRH